MTVAPQTLTDLQARLTRELHTVNLGIVGDASHVRTGGYHIGAKTLRANGMSNDYSLQFALDRNATSDYACAIDIGGSPELLMNLGNRIVHALKSQDPRVYGKVRGVNAPFDGVTIDRRYDIEDPTTKLDDNVQDSSDRGHIHLEVYRSLILDHDVMDGIFSVLAGEPMKFPPNSNRWSETVNKDEVLQLIRSEVVDAERATLKGGDHGYFTHERLTGLVKDEGHGVLDRLDALEKVKP